MRNFRELVDVTSRKICEWLEATHFQVANARSFRRADFRALYAALRI
jgi:hypothetical protein